MPANFTPEERVALLEKFYAEGYRLLQECGYKKLKIVDIASAVGIGTGTFYLFFKSKDAFFLWLLKQMKKKVWARFFALANTYAEGIPMPVFEHFLFTCLTQYNIYRCLKQADYDILQKKYSLLEQRNAQLTESGKEILRHLNIDTDLDHFRLFSEAYTIIIIGTSDVSKLTPPLTEPAIKQLVHAACQCLYR